jgi:hypothetical protein
MDILNLFHVQEMIAVVTGGGTGIVSPYDLVLIRVLTAVLNKPRF